ncbi:MAG: hypothetical protein Q9175_004833 [Cornicularia normoerica]
MPLVRRTIAKIDAGSVAVSVKTHYMIFPLMTITPTMILWLVVLVVVLVAFLKIALLESMGPITLIGQVPGSPLGRLMLMMSSKIIHMAPDTKLMVAPVLAMMLILLYAVPIAGLSQPLAPISARLITILKADLHRVIAEVGAYAIIRREKVRVGSMTGA